MLFDDIPGQRKSLLPYFTFTWSFHETYMVGEDVTSRHLEPEAPLKDDTYNASYFLFGDFNCSSLYGETVYLLNEKFIWLEWETSVW